MKKNETNFHKESSPSLYIKEKTDDNRIYFHQELDEFIFKVYLIIDQA